MAYDLVRRKIVRGDWTLGDEEADAEIPLVTAASDANRIVNKAVEEEQAAVEEMSRGEADEATRRAFQGFHDNFHKWLASTGSRPYGSLKLGTHGIYVTAFEYRKQIKDWRAVAAKSGAKRVGPDTRGVDVKTPEKSISMWAWVAVALGGAAAFTIIQRKVG